MLKKLTTVLILLAATAAPLMAAVAMPAPCSGTACCCRPATQDHHPGRLPMGVDDCRCQTGAMAACHPESRTPAALTPSSDRSGGAHPSWSILVTPKGHVNGLRTLPGTAHPDTRFVPNPPPRYLLVCALII